MGYEDAIRNIRNGQLVGAGTNMLKPTFSPNEVKRNQISNGFLGAKAAEEVLKSVSETRTLYKRAAAAVV